MPNVPVTLFVAALFSPLELSFSVSDTMPHIWRLVFMYLKGTCPPTFLVCRGCFTISKFNGRDVAFLRHSRLTLNAQCFSPPPPPPPVQSHLLCDLPQRYALTLRLVNGLEMTSSPQCAPHCALLALGEYSSPMAWRQF